MENSILSQYGFRSYYYIKNMGKSSCFCTSSGAGEITSKRKSEVIIVGAGVAGSALAHALGKDGRKVHVIERNLSEPKRIVGEILQPAGYLKLRELGLDDCVREIDAQHVNGYVLYNDGKSVRVPYPLEHYDNDVAGRSFHHGRFVQRMREKATSLPNVELVQGTATALIEDRGTIKGVKYKTRGTGQELTAYAPLTVVCDGCFSTFREFLSKPKIDKPSHFAGFIMENCQVPHPNYAHVFMGSSCFVLYPISSTEVRFLVDIPGPKIPSIANGQMAHFLKTVVAPQVPPELYKAFVSSVENTRIMVMPVSVMPAAPCLTPGALLLGDALNMRHAVTGGGMTVALHDVAIVCNLFRHVDLDDAQMVAKYTQQFYNTRKPMAFTMNVVADTLYNMIISPPDGISREMQQACFDYMSLGHDFTRGLVGLVSGLNPNPLLLGLHVFAMAIYVLGSKLLPVPSPRRVFDALRLATGAAAIVVPIMLKEGLSEVFFT